MSRPVALRLPIGAAGGSVTEARLALAEFLIGCDSLAECAQWSLDWLAEHAGLRRGLFFVVDRDRSRLTAAASYGGVPGSLSRLSVDLGQTEHALVAALQRRTPTEVSPATLGGRLRRSPLSGQAPFLAWPLRAPAGQESPGLLLVNPVTPEVSREAGWLAEILGPKIARQLTLQALDATRRRLESELALVQAMINTVPDPILLTDVEGRLVMANARAEALFVATEQDSEGRRRAIALNNMLFSAALTGRVFQGAEALRRELLLVDPSDGSDLIFELISTVTHGPGGDLVIVAVLRNVMDLRNAVEEIEENYRRLGAVEADVRAERDRLDLVIDSVADPILVTDPNGAIVLMNVPAERLFTVPPDAPGEVQVRVQANDAHFSSFLANVLTFTGDRSSRHVGRIGLVEPVSGRPLPVEAVAGKVLSQQGALIGIVTILHDQTEALERERLYAELKQASELLEERVRQATAELVRQNELLRRQALQLEQASALKSQFLANMSHEFRTPLNAILGYTSMLLQGVAGELPPAARRHLGRVDSSARHLLALINDILDISRIEAGKMPVHVAKFPVADLVTELLAEVEPLVARTSLTLHRQVAPDLPPMESDRAKVKQIVLNLLTNAVKFTPQGSVTIRVTYDDETDRIRLAVSDTGIGISPEDQQRIFDDFTQADASPTRAYGGAGLGLSISRRLAAMLGGEITLESAPGRGSTFTLSLPRVLAR
ncbi:MAG TPA: ATP-binding protein [Candidatus Binatia bacterium]|nr:ATP-binding protein [Candidatus Binatia bacterium]